MCFFSSDWIQWIFVHFRRIFARMYRTTTTQNKTRKCSDESFSTNDELDFQICSFIRWSYFCFLIIGETKETRIVEMKNCFNIDGQWEKAWLKLGNLSISARNKSEMSLNRRSKCSSRNWLIQFNTEFHKWRFYSNATASIPNGITK